MQDVRQSWNSNIQTSVTLPLVFLPRTKIILSDSAKYGTTVALYPADKVLSADAEFYKVQSHA